MLSLVISVSGVSAAYPAVEFHYGFFFPLLEVSCHDMLPCLCYQLQVECQVVVTCYLGAQHLSCNKHVPQIGLGICMVYK